MRMKSTFWRFAFPNWHGYIRRKPKKAALMLEKREKKSKKHQVYTLLVQVGRSQNDGLPKKATGAALICYSSGVDEAEAVRETVAILKQADLAPLDVTGYGNLDERLSEGHEIDGDEIELMNRALMENSVIVAQMTPLFGDEAQSGTEH